MIPRQWKVIQTVRERFSCRECEKITQPPAPFHVTPRGSDRFTGLLYIACCVGLLSVYSVLYFVAKLLT